MGMRMLGQDAIAAKKKLGHKRSFTKNKRFSLNPV
jgi:hypothetical protein